MRITPQRVTLVFTATFVVGMLLIAVKGLDAADRCIDVGVFAVISFGVATVAAVIGGVYSEKTSALGRAGNAVYGAVSLGLTVFALLTTVDVVLDGSPTVAMVVRREGITNARGRHWRVRVEGREWLLAERILGECATRESATLAVSRGALGQRWIRSVQCPR